MQVAYIKYRDYHAIIESNYKDLSVLLLTCALCAQWIDWGTPIVTPLPYSKGGQTAARGPYGQ